MYLFSGCGGTQSAGSLYLNYCKKEVPQCFENFEGMGKEVFPHFMSWGVFKYDAPYDCIKKEYLDDTLMPVKEYAEDSSVVVRDQKFTVLECEYFREDLSFYKNAIGENFIQAHYDCNNKIYIRGIKYPYVHEILYDTITHNVVHLVGTIRE